MQRGPRRILYCRVSELDDACQPQGLRRWDAERITVTRTDLVKAERPRTGDTQATPGEGTGLPLSLLDHLLTLAALVCFS